MYSPCGPPCTGQARRIAGTDDFGQDSLKVGGAGMLAAEQVRPETFSSTQSKNIVLALRQSSNTSVFEDWRSIPRPPRRRLKNKFLAAC
jgi:hypothetical protein